MHLGVKITLALGLSLVLMSRLAQAASCTGLRGTWEFTYEIEDTFTDIVIVRSINKKGYISGKIKLSGPDIPVHGYCKNNTVYLTEDYADNLINSWYFTTVSPRFAQYVPVFYNAHDFIRVWIPATVKKISSATNLALTLGTSQGSAEIRLTKSEQVERYYRWRHASESADSPPR